MARPLLRSLTLACALAALLPASALAAQPTLVETFVNSEWVLTYTAAADHPNDNITIQGQPGADVDIRFVVEGDAAIENWDVSGVPSPFCTNLRQDADTLFVDCEWSFYGRFVLNTGGGNDSIFKSYELVSGTQTTVFNASAGDDSFSQTSAQTDVVVANGTSGNDSLSGAAGADTLNGGSGDDSLFGGGGGDTLDGGADSDSLFGADGDDKLLGGTAGDSLSGDAGADMLDGGDGRDRLRGGPGADDIVGGEGFDLGLYDERGAGKPVRVSIDNAADDGEQCPGATCEGDNLHTDVEDLVGGAGADTLIGSAEDNVLIAGAGDDTLDGAAGSDTFIAADGADTLLSRDGNRESLDCGGGDDAVTGDEIDLLTDCERPNLSADLTPDADGDGVPKPTDCNDSNAAIKPGAPDAPDNGVDENCDGADAINPDRDGDKSPRPADCDDTNPAIRPGATEILGNRVDEDCDFVANPFPSITSTVASDVDAFVTYTRFKLLKVRDVRAGVTVEVRCKGRGCPRKSFKQRVRRRTSLLNILKAVRGRRLGVGTRLDVRLTAPQTIGRLVRFRIRRRALPSSSAFCLPPDSKKAVEC